MRALLFVCTLLASPALAQTDDRVSNDAMTLLAADSVVSQIGRLCVADTGNEAEVVAAFEGWRTRNHGWRIVGVSTLGTRGVPYSENALSIAQDELREKFMPLYEQAENKPDWCRRMASDIAKGELDAGLMFPEAATRIEEAKAGEWPVLDVENSLEVSDAVEVKRQFYYVEELMLGCAEKHGDPRGQFADAWPYWRMRNIEPWLDAEQTLRNWGALDPKWTAGALSDGFQRASKVLASDFSAVWCDDFIAGIEDGKDDLVTVLPELVQSIAEHAAYVPG